MCGITGVFNPNVPFDTRDFYNSHLSIKHRGPDDEGFVSLSGNEVLQYKGNDTIDQFDHLPHIQEVETSKLILGHRRLSIIDLSYSGHQPFTYKNLVLVYNGEIYNYKELRYELQKLGYVFETDTDTEVFLIAYYHFGNTCFEKFIGMWAAAIYNIDANEIILCRDFFGIKPLYYAKQGDLLLFGSEIKFLTTFDEKLKVVDERTIYDFVNHDFKDHTEHTFFKNINQLSPGSMLIISEEGIEKNVLTVPRNSKLSANDEVYTDISKTIDYHLIADVKVGISLSGGVDSTIVASYMGSKRIEFESFSSVFPNFKEFDESKYIKETVKMYSKYIKPNYIHTTLEDSWSSINETLDCLDEPYRGIGMFQPFSIYKKAADKGIKVLLGGQGADELFGGYNAQITEYYREVLKSGNIILIYKLFREKKITLGLIKQILLGENLLSSKNIEGYFKGRYSEPNYDSRTWFFNYGLREYLFYEDKLSMWHSVEGRVPFLTIKLYEKYAGLLYSRISNRGEQKILLKEAFKSVIPKLVYNRKDKMGYVSPQNIWLDSKKEEISDYLLKSSYYKNKLAKKEISDFDFNRLWRHYIVALWYEKKILN